VRVDCAHARVEQLAAATRLREHTRRALQPRDALHVAAARLRDHGRRAVLSRARILVTLSRAPSAHLERQRTRLHQQLREIRAGSRRRVESERRLTERRAVVLQRKAASSVLDCRERRPRELAQLALALAGHDPQRTLERGYVLAQSSAGEPILTAEGARQALELQLRFADGSLPARIHE
jgi:exodeoxyribonuclease VII large subunit